MTHTPTRPRLDARLLCLAGAFGLLLAVSGCNTLQGIGKDVEKAGEAIQKSVK